MDSTGKVRTLKPRIKEYSVDAFGYPVVSLCRNSITKTKSVHRLLANAFIQNPEGKPYIDHINRNTADYRIENLRWVTQKENINNPNSVEYCLHHVDRKESARLANATKKKKGTKTAPRTVFKFDLDGNPLGEYESISEAAIKNGLHKTAIIQVLDKQAYTAGGYLWATTRKISYRYSPNVQPYFKPVRQLDANGEVIEEWPSMTKAAKALGVSRKVIERKIREGDFVFVKS